jgi:heme exporter protein A
VRYGDRSVRALGSALRQRIGFLSHDLQLYPELTARENLEFFARLYGVSTPESLVNEALDCARLVNRADDPIVGFSRGMRQRLALERALLHEPRLVLLDEPFTGLDDRSIDDLAERLRALGRSDRIVIFATHDLDIAEKVLDRAIVLRNGRMGVLSDSGGTLRDRYRGFLANTNEQQRNLAGG